MSIQKKNTGRDYCRIIIIGNSGYPVHIIESDGPVSFHAEMVIWKDFNEEGVRAYRLKPGEQVEVFTMNKLMTS
ncbi:MAG: hypothetical protein AMJ75_03285 [Phycisphaerae bacterium SM1_79]|nr:MAG: hypothetical protein AMJ75_03285 [Phycisphaerae bacterium SM1_79]